MSLVLFFVFAVVAVAAAIIMVTHKNPVYSILFFILSLFAFSGFYVLLQAPFVAGFHIIFYSGIIMMVFFMSAIWFGLHNYFGERGKLGIDAILGIVASISLFSLLIFFIKSDESRISKELLDAMTMQSPGSALLTKYLFPVIGTILIFLSTVIFSLFLLLSDKSKT